MFTREYKLYLTKNHEVLLLSFPCYIYFSISKDVIELNFILQIRRK